MDVKSSAQNAAAIRHFAAEGLRSDINKNPPVDQSIDHPVDPASRTRSTEPARVYALTQLLMQSRFTGKTYQAAPHGLVALRFGVFLAAVTANVT
jgi:hypothetical protein